MLRMSYSKARMRFPVANGIFYPDSPETLAGQLASWGLKQGQAGLACGGQVIVAPHGAWKFTGNVTSAAFTTVQERGKNPGKPVKMVILMGSHHRSAEEGIYLSESVYFDTPLGRIPVDRKLNRRLASCSTLLKINDIPHLLEHSLEVLLPPIKYCFPEAKIVPVLIAGRRPVLISALARAIKIIFEQCMDECLFVISSNVSQDSDPGLALSMADKFCKLLGSMDSRAFLDSLAEGCISASGSVPVGAMLASGLFEGKRFSSLCPLAQTRGEQGETVYYGAFGCR